MLLLAKREKQLFFDLLKLYPLVPSAHQRLSKAANLPNQEANQRLLEEALAEQRAENKRQIRALLADASRSKSTESGHRLALSDGDMEWLLQILNDIRMGSWILLGSPEPELDYDALKPENAPYFWAMQLAGDFQSHLIEALERTSPS